MKQSIIVVLFAALVCSITQTGFAADVTLKFQGVQIRNMSRDIGGITIRCRLSTDRGQVLAVRDQNFRAVIDQNNNNSINSGPFELHFDVPDSSKQMLHNWTCDILFSHSGETKPFTICNPATPPQGVLAVQCVDARHFHLLHAGSTITP